ncbi:hypothetical protein PSHT_15210 [Puccinia striiformis]|uniref:Uncharacterized protein n=1 Tax=Puccinia striiformis TaxID=27350 RepID=A0A2S4UG98_9BASI|nr:hypothetical protein PSHT_15210 [Puccinia striiformis]
MDESNGPTPVLPMERWGNSSYGSVNKGSLLDTLRIELVIDEFERLRSKFSCREPHPDQASIEVPILTRPIDTIRVDSYEGILTEWLSELGRQVGTLSRLIDPEDMRKDPGANLIRLLELQPALDHNLTRIADSIALICPRPAHTSKRVDDQQLRQFKSYPLNELADCSSEVQFHMSCGFASACNHLERLDICMEYKFRDNGYLDVYKSFTEDVSVDIDFMINLLSGSELVGAKGYWGWGLRRMTRQFSKAIASLDSSTDHLTLQREYQTRQFLRQPVLHLTQLFIPVLKLSRLFFDKLSGPRMNMKRLPAYTQMNSKQLKRWFESTQQYSAYLSNLWDLLIEADGAPEGDRVVIREITEAARDLVDLFAAQMLLVFLYIVPLIPEADLNQNHYKNWFTTWNIQFTLAIDNYKQLARSLGHIP